jgi:peptide/nickel transport system ATP-binding protein
MALLDVTDLTVTFGSRPPAVDGVSFTVEAGQTVGLVGESGCGKSVTALAVMGLLPARAASVTGTVDFAGTDLLGLGAGARRDLRGRDLAMVFQDPLSSLNPVVPIGRQVAEVLERHRSRTRRQARGDAAGLLDLVGIPDPGRRLGEYPHQLSGGMRQRALIAMALACEPRLLIADEPTTALDVTIQAQILALLSALVRDTGTALVLITHDLGVVAGLCDEVNVLYSGRVVERAERHELFARPRHPYTAGLLASIPRLDGDRRARLVPIRGTIDEALPWATGCAFTPRCPNAQDDCAVSPPAMTADVRGDRAKRCHHPVGGGDNDA